MLTHKVILSLAVVFFITACDKYAQFEYESTPITFDVYYDSAPKSLILTTVDLESDCLFDGDASNCSIGVLSSLTFKGKTYSNLFDNNSLFYTNPNWNFYNANNSIINYYWVKNAQYKFSFFYPFEDIKKKMTVNGQDFLFNLDTQLLQKDIMLSSVSVSTLEDAATGPIPVQMKHALSAIKITFEFDGYNDADYITSCWLENSDAQGIATKATLNFTHGIENPSFDNFEIPLHPFYKWTCSDGVAFSTNGTEVNKAIAYTSTPGITSGDSFVNNNGYIMLIPQTLHGEGIDSNTLICFTAKRFGSEVLRVKMPKSIASTVGSSNAFLAGHKYTIAVKIKEFSASYGFDIEVQAYEDVINDIVFN